MTLSVSPWFPFDVFIFQVFVDAKFIVLFGLENSFFLTLTLSFALFTVSVWVLQEADAKMGLDVQEITRGNTFRQQYRFNPEEDKGKVGLGRKSIRLQHISKKVSARLQGVLEAKFPFRGIPYLAGMARA